MVLILFNENVRYMKIKLKYLGILTTLFILAVSCKKEEDLKFHPGNPVIVSNFNSTMNLKWDHDYQGPGIDDSVATVDGSPSYLEFSGVTWQKDSKGKITSPYITYMTMPASSRDNGLATDKYYPLYLDPTKVYFNVYVYNAKKPGEENKSTAWLIISFKEELLEGETPYTKQIVIKNPTWTGWKLLTFKYSDIPASDQYGNPTVAIGKSHLITSVEYVFLSTQSDLSLQNKVELYLDKAQFTFNMPLVE